MSDIAAYLEEFRKHHPDPGSVGFLMMSFSTRDPYPCITASIKDAFKRQGADLFRADDCAYSSDLSTNIRTYMHGCGFGVAVFDRISEDEFNPNVSLEVGFMMALGKPVCILKDRYLKSLQADLLGKLYIDFDPYNPKVRLEKDISKWMVSNKINPRIYRLSVHLRLAVDYWGDQQRGSLIEGIRKLVPYNT